MKIWLLLILFPSLYLQAQPVKCVFKDPVVQINFGYGDAIDPNISNSPIYSRVNYNCPTDGYYSYVPYTSDCFNGDWITMIEDHTPGDLLGNMLLINSAYDRGEFFSTMIRGLQPGKDYEFAVWMTNVCRPSSKCPFPLLPNISMRLETARGTIIAELRAGELVRYETAQWKRYSILFTMPMGSHSLSLTMNNHNPGGCGNDFAVDDITFRECVPPPPPVITKQTITPPAKTTPAKKQATTNPDNTARKKPLVTTSAAPPKKDSIKTSHPKPLVTENIRVDSAPRPSTVTKSRMKMLKPPPPALTNRTNALATRIELEAGEIRIDLYDNGQIDGDTVTIYHNNELMVSRAGLTEKALTIRIRIDTDNPYHELVMVANNLGSIPPNTSLMVVTAGSKRYEIFISSNDQKNAKVVFDLKE